MTFLWYGFQLNNRILVKYSISCKLAKLLVGFGISSRACMCAAIQFVWLAKPFF